MGSTCSNNRQCDCNRTPSRPENGLPAPGVDELEINPQRIKQDLSKDQREVEVASFDGSSPNRTHEEEEQVNLAKQRQEEEDRAREAEMYLERERDRKREQDELDAKERARLEEEKKKDMDRRRREEEEAKAKAYEREAQERAQRKKDYEAMLEDSRTKMKQGAPLGKPNRYGEDNEGAFPDFDRSKHIPTLALINELSGAKSGKYIMDMARRLPYYQDRFFNIIDIVKGQRRGGLLDVFREELVKAKDEAKAMGTRPRLISGGGDGTASFALFIVLKALRADDNRKEDGLEDKGNGFIWTDNELQQSFPALAQCPLGSANDFGNITGWGQKYPGDPGHSPSPCCLPHPRVKLRRWLMAAIDPQSLVVDFDVWGIMPPPGQEKRKFKIAELTGKKGLCPKMRIDGKNQLVLKEAGLPVPFFLCLYFSMGFGAYMVARFQLNRRSTPIRNRLEYIRQGVAIVFEPTPPQTRKNCDGLTVACKDAADQDKNFLPPRPKSRSRSYWEVGFYNINWQAHLLHGATRQSLPKRLAQIFGCRTAEGVRFNDGLLDSYRMRFFTHMKNPGLTMQTEKKKDFRVTYEAAEGQGFFFQYDGESRFAFSPTCEAFQMHIRKVFTIPIVIGPRVETKLTGKFPSGSSAKFEFCGETRADVEQLRGQIFKFLSGELDKEMLATKQDLQGAKFIVD